VLFLDHRSRLLADEAQQRGILNHTQVYPCDVAKRALELHATTVILMHNNPVPSRDGIAMTQEITAAALSVVVHEPTSSWATAGGSASGKRGCVSAVDHRRG